MNFVLPVTISTANRLMLRYEFPFHSHSTSCKSLKKLKFKLKWGILKTYSFTMFYIFNPIQGVPELRIQVGEGKNACATYFGHISSMEARIFMKFETYVHKIVLEHQPNFHKDPCKDALAQGENVRTYQFQNKSTKNKKIRFSAIFD